MKDQILIHQPSEEPLIIDGADRELRNEIDRLSKLNDMKEKIIDIINSEVLYTPELNAQRLIVLFNQRLLDMAKESSTVSELLEKTFINI